MLRLPEPEVCCGAVAVYMSGLIMCMLCHKAPNCIYNSFGKFLQQKKTAVLGQRACSCDA